MNDKKPKYGDVLVFSTEKYVERDKTWQEGKEEIGQAYKMRNALQKEIDKGERDLLKQQKIEIKEK